MDYGAFFADVQAWIGQANQAAARFGMESPAFWQWAADSTGAMCRKYNDHRLAIKQMMMLVEWLEEVYEGRKNP
ncbi:hypothetical protein KIH86_13950 [Paenibacillus sp. HN-1]|uniref:hypothetical protein n=1 Tax=Paenibacillus TaxID=44249 RepID=UPI001CA9DAF8|nr:MULTISPECIES: hypothetical protein [Paenibacillus]MBY9082365.1 hypothetical protein [Paenibacillus sp. CGMCC 1.18879]MBY9085331.1 hypothetical protein [Paenibacillus sinensis]